MIGRAILAVALVVAAAPGLAAQKIFDGCPMAGDARASLAVALNRLKNRYTAPPAADLDPAATLAALLTPGNDSARWSDARGATITGYVEEVKPGGVETANCRARDLPDEDTHIALVATPDGRGLPVIVEVTPRWRARMAARGVDWSTRALRRQLLGRWVRVTGWLLFDAEHAGQAENTEPGRPRDWRATAWEIHPITGLTVVSRPRP